MYNVGAAENTPLVSWASDIGIRLGLLLRLRFLGERFNHKQRRLTGLKGLGVPRDKNTSAENAAQAAANG